MMAESNLERIERAETALRADTDKDEESAANFVIEVAKVIARGVDALETLASLGTQAFDASPIGRFGRQ